MFYTGTFINLNSKRHSIVLNADYLKRSRKQITSFKVALSFIILTKNPIMSGLPLRAVIHFFVANTFVTSTDRVSQQERKIESARHCRSVRLASLEIELC